MKKLFYSEGKKRKKCHLILIPQNEPYSAKTHPKVDVLADYIPLYSAKTHQKVIQLAEYSLFL